MNQVADIGNDMELCWLDELCELFDFAERRDGVFVAREEQYFFAAQAVGVMGSARSIDVGVQL